MLLLLLLLLTWLDDSTRAGLAACKNNGLACGAAPSPQDWRLKGGSSTTEACDQSTEQVDRFEWMMLGDFVLSKIDRAPISLFEYTYSRYIVKMLYAEKVRNCRSPVRRAFCRALVAWM
jgi:hypothetical protein